MKISAQFLFLIIAFCNCNSRPETKKIDKRNSDSSKAIKQIDSTKKNIVDCIPIYKDTTGSNFSVKYLDSVTFYTVQLRIGNIERVLNYRFDCSTIGSTVPNFRDYNGQWLCLSRGCSDHCVIYYLFKKEGNIIKEFKSFDHAYDIDLKNSFCAVVDKGKEYPAILIIDYLRNKCVSKALITKKSFRDIVDLRLAKSKIDILYNDSSRQVINFLKTDFTETIPEFTEADPPPSIERLPPVLRVEQ